MPNIYSKPHLGIYSTKHLGYRLKLPEHELAFLAENGQSLYRTWLERKKKGGMRNISSPLPRMRIAQEAISNLLLEISLSPATYGGVRGFSIKNLAQGHCKKPNLLSLDFSHFFPSIHPLKVYHLFLQELHCSPEVARLLTKITTLNFELPQGAPSSPAIANLICRKLDMRLIKFSHQVGLSYSRWVDDLYFSGDIISSSLIKAMKKIIQQEGFRLKSSKEVLSRSFEKQTVVGINVNGPRPKVTREYKKKLRAEWHKTVANNDVHTPSVDSRIKGKYSYIQFIES